MVSIEWDDDVIRVCVCVFVHIVLDFFLLLLFSSFRCCGDDDQSRQLVPLLDRVLVRRLMAQEKTSTGILLPESSMKRVNEGTVVAVGSGACV